MRKSIPCLAALAVLLGSSCKKELSATGNPLTVTLLFTDVVGMSPLQLESVNYQDAFGENFVVDTFRYYISNVQLIGANGAIQPIPGIAQSVDAADSSSLSVSFPASGDSVVAVSFTIGEDSPSRSSATLSGISSASAAPGNVFDYSLMGNTGSNSVVRRVILPLTAPINVQPILPDTAFVWINVNLEAWFSSAHSLPINVYSTCLTPGTLAAEYADNSAKMFSVVNVIVQ